MAAAIALDEETTAKVLRQIEYYFSDTSLPSDNFMLQKIEESEDGLIDLSLVCNFKKMKSHLDVKESEFPAEKLAAVAEVLRSKSSFLRLSEDGKRVGRVHEVLSQAVIDARSIAANPFPHDIKMNEVEAIFKEHAEVKSVQLAKHKSNRNIPSGFAVIELSSEEEAQKVLKMELTCQGATLELETKTAFDARKEILLENDKKNVEKSQKRGKDSERQEDNEEYTKGLIVSFTAKKIGTVDDTDTAAKAADIEKAAEAADIEKAAEAADAEKADDTDKAAEAVDTEGGDQGQELSRKDIQEVLTKFGIIRYVEYAKGDTSGFLRMDQSEDAQKLIAAAAAEPEGGLTIAEHLLTFETLEGEAEENYWKKLRDFRTQRFGGGRGGYKNRGRGRGGRGRRGRGYKRSHDGEGPKSKSQKTD